MKNPRFIDSGRIAGNRLPSLGKGKKEQNIPNHPFLKAEPLLIASNAGTSQEE